ncbi:MAG: tlde1 domain-containing protein [Bdellovibrio sp.]
MNNPSYSSGNFVSGNGANANNPAATDILNSGPLPVGSYSVGPMNPGSKRRNLTPLPGTDLGNRTGGFQTHGCSNPSTCSNGCIAATTNGDRDLLNFIFGLEEGNNTINVVP